MPAFRRFWLAVSLSSAGSAVTTVAVPVLLVTVLGASALEVGIARAAQFLPYALLGLPAGVVVDRVRRRPLFALASALSGVLLAVIPVAAVVGRLSLPLVVGVLFAFGTTTMVGVAASQSLLPRLVPRDRLLEANARADQTDAVAQTAGPAAGGALVAALGAPFALLIDAVSFVAQAVLIASVRVAEGRPGRRRPHLARDIAEGLRAAYRDAPLRALSLSTHVWFLANSAALTVLAPFALRGLRLGAFGFGVVLAAAGIATLVGTLAAARSGVRFGAGPTILGARLLYPAAWLAVAFVPAGPLGAVLLGAALAVAGFAGGLENANELGYRQAVTPDGLLGRVNASLRSVNRSAAVLGAFGGGLLSTIIGMRPSLGVCVVVFAIAAVVIAVSAFARARIPAHPDPPHPDPDTLAG